MEWVWIGWIEGVLCYEEVLKKFFYIIVYFRGCNIFEGFSFYIIIVIILRFIKF